MGISWLNSDSNASLNVRRLLARSEGLTDSMGEKSSECVENECPVLVSQTSEG